MKKLSRLCVLLLALMAVLAVLSMEAPEASAATDPFQYMEQDGKVYIIGYSGTCPEELVFPSEYNGKPVYGIAQMPWNGWNVKSIVIPDSIVSIGRYALEPFYNAESLTVGSGVNCLSYELLQGNRRIKNLTISADNPYYMVVDGVVYDKDVTTLVYYPMARSGDLVIPATVTNIDVLGNYSGLNVTFADGSVGFVEQDGVVYTADMKKIVMTDKTVSGVYDMPDSVEEIVSGAFSGCEQLTAVDISNSVTTITYGQFMGCTALEKVTIPSSVTAVEGLAFTNCNALEQVHISDLEAWCRISFDYNGNPLGFAHNLYLDGELIVDLVIPQSITELKAYVFEGGACFESVAVHPGVTKMGYSAFYDCVGLKKVKVEDVAAWCGIEFEDRTANPLRYAGNLYMSEQQVKSLVIPEGVTSIGQYAFTYGTGFTSVSMPNGLQSIGDYAFEVCDNLTEVAVPGTVSGMGSYIFQNCTGLEKATLGAGMTYTGNYTFYNCTSLSQVSLPEGLLSINQRAFKGTKALETLILPSTLEEIEWYAFEDSGLTAISIPDSVEFLGTGVFHNCTKLKDVELGEGCSYVPRYGFRYCTSLEKITLPEAVTNIEDEAFYGCTSLTTVNFPSKPLTIGEGAFAYCPLSGIRLPDGTAIIDRASFACCGMTEMTIPVSVTEIAYYSFAGCSNLAEIVIPKSVTTIGEWAFSGCSKLEDVYYTGNETQWQAIDVGYGNDDLLNATIHYNYILEGDMDSNLFIEDRDALYLLRHTLFEDTYPLPCRGDVNADSTVTDEDAVYLLRYVLFPQMYPLYTSVEPNG